MKKKIEPSLDLQAALPKTTHINKPMLTIAVGIVAFIIAIALLGVFTPKTQKTATTKIAAQDLTPQISPMVQQLPQSYKQTGEINKYLQAEDQGGMSKDVKEQLASLKEQAAALQQQLQALKSKGPQVDQLIGQQKQQAQRSSLFFAGALPPRKTQPFATAKTKGKNGDQQGDSDLADALKTTSYEKQNMQSQKTSFLKTSAEEDQDIYNLHSMTTPASPYELQAGSIIPAVLITAINTSLPGNVVAQTRRDIFDTVAGKFLLIPKGSKLLGEYDSQVSFGQQRVLIAFTRIIRPDGSSILLGKTGGADLAGRSGMSGNVDSHWGSILAAATLSTMLSVGTGVASDSVGRGNGSNYYPSSGQNALTGAASGVAATGQQITSRALDVQPTLTIPAGYEFNIIVNKDTILKPYNVNR